MLTKSISIWLHAVMVQTQAVILAGLLVSFAKSANASPIEVDLGPPGTITSQTPSSPFEGLSGTPLDGQNGSIDFSFSNNEFVRLFTVTPNTFEVSINLQTNGSGFVGFLEGTGYVVDMQGNAIPGFGITGAASGNDGSLAIGLFPLLKDEDGTPNRDLLKPLDFYGIHFDWSYPDINDPSIHVIGGEFALISNGGVFGIGPGLPRDIVPDSGSTLFLLGTTVMLTIGLRAWRS